MANYVIIKLKTKDDKEIERLNVVLDRMNIGNAFTTEQMNINWWNDINNNIKSSQKHLKPITLSQLKKNFTLACEVGCLLFNNESRVETKKYIEFILSHSDQIKVICNPNELL